MWIATTLFTLLLQVSSTFSVDPLGTFNVDPSTVSVSGFSSGASFSSQIHVALSSEIYASATLAGVPYGCYIESDLFCIQKQRNVTVLIQQAQDYEVLEQIDPTQNLVGAPTFIWQHSLDCSRLPASLNASVAFFEHFGADVTSSCNQPNGHGYPTLDYGNPCESSESPFVNDCDYNMAYVSLDYILDDIVEPEPGQPLNGQFLEYDQLEFVPEGEVNSFDALGGWVYVPSACQSGELQCRLHVFFHGCTMGRAYLGDEVVRNIGLLEMAEVNNIVTLFPQLIDREGSNGCFDYDGHDGDDFATKFGVQIVTVQNMIHRALGL